MAICLSIDVGKIRDACDDEDVGLGQRISLFCVCVSLGNFQFEIYRARAEFAK